MISTSPAQAASPPAIGRADDAAARAAAASAASSTPATRVKRAVERHLAQGGVAAELVLRQHLHLGQQAERDRQVEMAAFLQHVGRREIDRDAPRRQREAEHGASAARTRSRDSATALSGRPTTLNAGSPEAIVTWVSTSMTSTP